MSLINDALQRAKQVQDTTLPPTGPGLQLRPAEASQRPAGNPSRLLFATIAAIVALGAFFTLKHLDGSHPLPPTPADQAAVNTATATATTTPAPAAKPASISVAATAAGLTALARNPEPVVATNATASIVEAPPKPAPPRLQAIVFDARRPSAIINGKTVFLNSQVGEFRVAAIRPDSATLVSGTGTIVLTLPE